MTRQIVAIGILLATLLGVQLASSPAHARYGMCGGCGTVVDVDRIYYDRDSGREGAILGAIIGGALGNQVGRGSGRRAATVAGAVAGGLIGRKVDRNDGRRHRGERGVRLEVRMDGGGYRVVEVHGDMRIYRGDRVRLRRDRVELID